MARYDKYEPYAGGFRAALAVDWLAADVNKVIGVGLNTSGAVVKGAGNTGVIGVLVLTKARKAKEIVDVMRAGEIVDFNSFGPVGAATAFASVAGTNYGADVTTGLVTAGGTIPVGFTVESTRLHVGIGVEVA